jgi:hypothetical protein
LGHSGYVGTNAAAHMKRRALGTTLRRFARNRRDCSGLWHVVPSVQRTPQRQEPCRTPRALPHRAATQRLLVIEHLDARGKVGNTDKYGAMLMDKEKAPPKRGFRDAIFCSQERESSETPKLNAFCRVAPVLRLSDRAIFAAGVF